MAELKDAVLSLSILAAMILFVFGTGAVDLPGTGSSSYICSLPVASDFVSSCGNDVSPNYDVSTSIVVQATDTNAKLNEGSFEYKTSKSSAFNQLSLIGLNRDLAFGGANDVQLNFQMFDSDDTLVADGSKYIGELGVLQTETVEFDVDNRPTGDYTVKYRLTYTPDFGVSEGVQQEKTLEKNIRVPERIE